jgi:signal transduction histidine kinase
MLEMQSAFRGFLLTEDESFLDSYEKRKKQIPNIIEEEKKLLKNSSQKEKLDSIVRLHKQWVQYSSSLISAKRRSGESPLKREEYLTLFNEKLRKNFGKNLNDQISAKFNQMNAYEYKVRQNRREMLMDSIQRTRIISLSFILLTIVICVVSSIYVVGLITKRINSMVKLAEKIAQGEFVEVDDKKEDELSSLSISLNIMSENLKKNIRQLENRNLELNQFASVVSHDLKAPLRGIHNVISWIEEDMGNTLSDPLKKYLSIIPERIGRMENLINGLLDYARISREKPHKEVVSIQHLVEAIVDSIVPRTFKVSISKLPTFATERIRIEQVFSNLISNAVKYSKNECGRIKVTCQEFLESYEFTVQDDGIGIDPQFHERIFVIFQTLREKNSVESTGIGLSIVKKILEEQHSTIRVESSLGNGSSFIFTWPKSI